MSTYSGVMDVSDCIASLVTVMQSSLISEPLPESLLNGFSTAVKAKLASHSRAKKINPKSDKLSLFVSGM